MAIYKMLLAGRCGMSEDELEKTIDKINKKTNIKIKGIYNKDLNDVRYVLEL